MAYKYQSLAATMSGSLTQEGDFAVHDHSGVEKATIGCIICWWCFTDRWYCTF